MFLEDPGLPAMDLSPTSEPAVVSTVEADTSMAPTPASMTIHVIGEDEEPQEMLKAFPAELHDFGMGLWVGWKFGNLRNEIVLAQWEVMEMEKLPK